MRHVPPFLAFALALASLALGLSLSGPESGRASAAESPVAAGSESVAMLPAAEAVILSEFMAVNVATLADEDGEFSDWIELLNTGPSAVPLAGWVLTDDARAPARWTFPATNLAPGGRLVVFASGKDRRVPGALLHANFQLSSDGEYLALLRPDGTVASAYAPTFPRQRADVSYGLLGDVGASGYLAVPTPGAANGMEFTAFVADTKFSHDRGFYETNFVLVITCETPGATVFYTTNGSAPSATNGAAYTGPIPVGRTTVIRACAEKPGFRPSNVDTHTYVFLRDVLTQSPDGSPPPGWPALWGDNVVDYGMDPDIVAQPPWSATISNDLRAVPTLSLGMRLEDLFDPQTGIYANASAEGRAWERPCSLELVYPDGRPGFAVRAGLRIRGGFSRSTDNPKHSLRFLMREEYGDPKLRFGFFGPTGTAEFDKFDLRTSQDGSWAFLGDVGALFVNDPFSRDTALALGQPGERGDWYHLYINGQYWGLYNSCERPEASFAASYLGGAPEDWDVLKPDPQRDYTVRAVDGDDRAWTRLWQAATNGFARTADYFRVQGRNPDGTVNPTYEDLLEVTNLVDYLLVVFWTGNFDGPIFGALEDGFLNNFYALRDRTGARGGFRIVTHDAELSLMGAFENRIGTTGIGNPARGDGPERCNPYYLWTQLLPNEEFRTLVEDRVQKHFFAGGALTREACTARFLLRRDEIDRAIVGESARWGDAQRPDVPLTRDDWTNVVHDRIVDYFPFRSDIVLDQLREAGLFPALAAPQFGGAGGEVPVGYALALMQTNAAGELFYTVDGTDPRAIGGGLGVTALNYSAPIPITGSMLVRARVKDGATWSPIVEALYYPAQDYTGLQITELMYHPAPEGPVDGDEFEFLELKNTGTNSIDLGGVFFTGITFTFTNGTRLPPGGFFVLARNPTNFAARYPGVLPHGLYSGRLDNRGEEITLRTAAGGRILSVTYNDRAPWPAAADGYGFSLVPANPGGAADPNAGSHWRASSKRHGSPGSDDPPSGIPPVVINEILTRADTPGDGAIELYNPTAQAVDLSGWYLTDDPTTPRKFRIGDETMVAPEGYLYFTAAEFNAGGAGFALNAAGGDLYLFSGTFGGTDLTGYSHGVHFGAAALGVSFGRYLNSVGEEQFPAQLANTLGLTNAGPRVGPAVLNEIHYHPLTNYDEYVEVLNISEGSLDLFDPAHPTNAWRVNGLNFDFPGGVTLPAGGLALVAGIDPAVFRAKYAVPAEVPVFGPFAGALQNSGERLELQRPDVPDPSGSVSYITVDEVRYNDRAPWPVAADGDGSALQRLVPAAYGNDPTNWFASGLTPGRRNHLNQVPVARLLSPTNGAEFPWPSVIPLEASASDEDGSVTRLEFFDGSERIGEVTNAPYRLAWVPLRTGIRRLSVKAHDNELASSLSVPISIAVLPPSAGSGLGLRGEYFNDVNFGGPRVARLDPAVDFTWPDQPHPSVGADAFSVRWTGRLQTPFPALYTLYTRSADGVRLWLNGVLLIDNWIEHAETENSATLMLEAGPLHDLRLEFFNASGLARIQLAWSAAGLPREPVPRERLYPPVNLANQPPTVAFINPVNQSAFPPDALDLRVEVTDPDGALYLVRFFTNGVQLGQRSAPPFQFTWANPPLGSHQLTAVAVDDNLGTVTSPPVRVHIVRGYTTNETLLAAGARWRYWDRGSKPATDWTARTYDDSAWSEGFAELGYGDGDEATVVSYGPRQNQKYITTYFRRTFNLPAPESITDLQLNVIRDDGVAVSLNGQEVLRDNLPAGPLDFATTALVGLALPEEATPLVAGASPSLLAAGLNVVAAEVHQVSESSSDLSFDLELTATRSLLAPFILTQPQSVIVGTNTTVSLRLEAGGTPPLGYQWRLGETLLPGRTNTTLLLTDLPLAPSTGYSAIVTNALGAVTSQIATVTVTNTPPPPGLSVVAKPAGAEIRFLRLAGHRYTIECSADLTPGSWQSFLDLPPQAFTEPFELTMPAATPPSRFFRVVAW